MPVDCDALKAARDTMPGVLGVGDLYDSSHGLYCGLGWLGYCAGMTPEELDHRGDNDDRYGELRDRIGLAKEDTDLIWQANDRAKGSKPVGSYSTTGDRHAVLAVLGYLIEKYCDE